MAESTLRDQSVLPGGTLVSDVVRWVREKSVAPLFLCVTGSHMWHLARPESDLDIRGIYVEPVDRLLALHAPKDTIEGRNCLGGLVDLQLYEIRKALLMLAANNGNIVEMLLSPTAFYLGGLVDWRSLAKKYLTKKLRNYYAGYMQSQRQRAMQNRGGKAAIYAFREVMAGITLMETGEIIYDFHELKTSFEHRHDWHSDLLDWYLKRENWGRKVTEEQMDRFLVMWDQLVEILDMATVESTLPDDYDGRDELEGILSLQRTMH